MTSSIDNLSDPGRAYPMALLGGPVSPEAEGFVRHLIDTSVLPGRSSGTESGSAKQQRQTSEAKLVMATGALMADLFDFHRGSGRHPMPVRGAHGMSKGDFPASRLGFSLDIFQYVRTALVAAGLITETQGSPMWKSAFGRIVNMGGLVTTFGLTAAALDLAERHSVPVNAWDAHWTRVRSGVSLLPQRASTLGLRAMKERIKGKPHPSRELKVDPSDPEAEAIITATEELNHYLGAQDFQGLAFGGLRRIFNNGDQPDFVWNKGGRFYSQRGGHFYEVWSAERRQDIRINGEAVTEVDLRASHLTLLHALLGADFNPTVDPYHVGDWPRAVVKAWVSQAIGSSNPRPVQWSRRSQADYEEERPGRFLADEFPVREVGAEVKSRHPVLEDVGTCGLGPLDLQFHEAEILRRAMEDLMLRQDIPVLPIHDALIAPRSRAEDARRALEEAFAAHVEAVTGSTSSIIPKVTFEGRKAV